MFISQTPEYALSPCSLPDSFGEKGGGTGSGKTDKSAVFRPDRDMYVLKRKNNARRRYAVSFSCLAKIASADTACLLRWKYLLKGLLEQATENDPVTESPLVIGLAESGIIPSAFFHQLLREKSCPAFWICSTRRPAGGIPFTESHSHGPDHMLPVPGFCPTELCFAEDEITTGKTLLRLSIRLCRLLHVKKIRIFAFSDHRTRADRKVFLKEMESENIRFSTHILTERDEQNHIPPDMASEEEPQESVSDNHSRESLFPKAEKRTAKPYWEKQWLFPAQRPGLSACSNIRIPVPEKRKGTLLALGEAVDMGFYIAGNSPETELRHITLSPWEIDGKYIFSRMEIASRYYIYNYHTLRPPLFILSDPTDLPAAEQAAQQLRDKGFPVEVLN